ncbi:MAG: ABC transporter ATP-binding protein, partial [Thermoprotei archaeon]
GVDLLVRRGEIFGLLGPNGAGKTTTIRMILGLIRPTKGSVKIFGIPVEDRREEVLKVTGYMPQRFSLYEDLTVEENLLLYGRLYGLGRREVKRRVREMLEEFMLEEFKYRLAGKLSGGTKQRLALAVALIHNPRLLVVDEPTAGVDPPIRRYFWDYFRRLRKEGITILLTTHYMDEAEHCDRLALMNRGKIVAEGSPVEIKRFAFKGEIVEVIVNGEGVSEALNELSEVKEVLEDSKDGAFIRLRLLVEDASQDLLRITKVLERRGFKVYRASQVFVSLEDAFIKLTTG